MTDRSKRLRQIEHLLNTPDGIELMEELALTWDMPTLLGVDTQRTAYHVGLRDAYKFLEMLQNGEIFDG